MVDTFRSLMSQQDSSQFACHGIPQFQTAPPFMYAPPPQREADRGMMYGEMCAPDPYRGGGMFPRRQPPSMMFEESSSLLPIGAERITRQRQTGYGAASMKPPPPPQGWGYSPPGKPQLFPGKPMPRYIPPQQSAIYGPDYATRQASWQFPAAPPPPPQWSSAPFPSPAQQLMRNTQHFPTHLE
ncbi:hypothetical protein Ciccas_007645 [Cichlidogyrus casuarinus]|uniref:Uncharacterized protein n=1 Tax=Cichlidogyrus casuarinus TaxID=1844966 RepID=A0ABD2Q3F9_9PLAT